MSKVAFNAVLGTAFLLVMSMMFGSVPQAFARAASSETEALLDPYDGGVQWDYGPRRWRHGGHGGHGGPYYGGNPDAWDPPCAEVVIVDGSGAKHQGVRTFASLARALKCVPRYNPLTILVAEGSSPINFPRRHFLYRAPEVTGRVIVKPLLRSFTLVSPPGSECFFFSGGEMIVEGATWTPGGGDRRAVPCIVANGGRLTFVRNKFAWRGGTAIIAGPGSIVTLARSTVTSDGVGLFVDRGRLYSIGSNVTANSHLASPDALGSWSNNPAITVRNGSLSATSSTFSGDIGLAVLGTSRVRLVSCLDSRRQALCPDSPVTITGNQTGVLLHRASGVTIEDARLEAREGGTVVRSIASTASVQNAELDGGSIGLYLARGGNFELANSYVSGQSEYGLYFGPGAAGRIYDTEVLYLKPAKCFGPSDQRLSSHSGVSFDDDDCERDRGRPRDSSRDNYHGVSDRHGSSRDSSDHYGNGRDDYQSDRPNVGRSRPSNRDDETPQSDGSFTRRSSGSSEGSDYGTSDERGHDESDQYAPPADDSWYGAPSDYSDPDEREYVPEDAGYRPAADK